MRVPGLLPPAPAVILTGMAVALGQAAAGQGSQEALEHFENAVRPVLVEHCVQCHSGEKPKGGLRLDSADGIRAGAFGEPIVIPEDLEASTIVEVVRYEDPLFAMPPSEKLPDDAIRAIERWVELGAAVPDDMDVDGAALVAWNLLAPKPLDATLLTAAEESGRDWIDVALEARLTEAGVEASEPAAPLRWLRRVTFDLTGLPPTPEESSAFMATGAGRDARAEVVDRLLGSPAFGERWARRWLDLVRYAETRAHEFDFDIPNAFEYRDYVIRAFDADVPYDRFVTELLAGDLVDEPRLDPTGTFNESALGTGALFLGEEVHSPVEIRGDQTDRIAHQVEVLSKSVLAMGVACARCHDHKFDPISAEDYHALAGFTLSTAAAQVRYETDGHNRRLAAELAAFLDEIQPAATSAVADALEAEAKDLGPVLVSIATAEPSTGARDHITMEAATALDAAFQSRVPGFRPALLLEDFEAESFDDGGLGPWERVGEAFMDRPLRSDDTATRPELEPRGTGSINSYAGEMSSPESTNSDRFVGTLTSRPFPAVRRYLHLLVNGGDEEEVRVEVLDAESGEVLGKVHGKRSNRLTPARIDLGEFQGRDLRVRFVDEHTGGWGQIGGDQLVLADEEHEGALDAARSVRDWTQLVEDTGPQPDGAEPPIDLARILAWEPLVRDPRVGSALTWLMHPPEAAPEDQTLPVTADDALIAYGELEGVRWIVNGPAFGPGPTGPMRVVLDLDAESQGAHVAAISTQASALAHPTWADLTVAPGTKTSRGGSFSWVQGGRTLLSPMFESESGRLGHLVRGKAKVLWVVAGHKMISGPLHQGVIKTIDTGGDWAWIEQRVETAAGLRGHLEFTARSDEIFEVALTVDLDPDSPMPSSPAKSDWWSRAEQDGDLDFSTAEGRAGWLERALKDAAELLRTGGVAGRALEDGERALLLRLAEDVARRHPAAAESIASALEKPAATLATILDARALESRLAPVSIDLDGRDEFVLDRGSWRVPGAKAPRRAPSALRASDAPLALEGEGSGRLALAQSLIESPTKTLQRVWVNRLWQAMFSTGLVTTPDDFGAMGAKPSHPGVLDQLALDFERDGWSTKGLLRRLALSDAYARSTTPTPSCAEHDPLNVLLARMNVRRLEAEEIRDGLLAASGELDGTRFGAPVPIHLTGFMTGRGRPDKSGPLDGAGRRSIYLAVRRNFPHPFLTVFDCPSPSTCHGKRNSSNVPAQALTLMNDPFVEERAVHLADSVLAIDGESERLEALWLRVLGRLPSESELAAWQGYARDGAEGAEADDSEFEDPAAWVDLAHVLFNVKDFLFLR